MPIRQEAGLPATERVPTAVAQLMVSLRRYLITGFLVSLPLVVTVYVIWFVFSFLDGIFGSLIQAVLGRRVPGAGTVLTVSLLLLVGMFGANVLGRRLIAFGERILLTIPLVRSIYHTVKQIVEAFSLDGKGNSFKRVVLVEYPRKGMYAVGFVTNDAAEEIEEKLGERTLGVFVASTPNPTSGFILMVPETEVVPLDMTVEQASKLIFSGGILTPPRRARTGGSKEEKIDGSRMPLV